MRTIGTLNDRALQTGLTFVVIGGHAVAAHGFARGTEDFDLLTSKEQRDRWKRLLEDLGYSQFHDGVTFLQFKAPSEKVWDVDVMFTNETTFAKIIAGSKLVSIAGVEARIPALEHLLALKIHALAHTTTRRFLKDFDDVVNLVLANKIDVRSDEFRRLVENSGSADLYEKIVRFTQQ